jgi:hypothetical protein
LWIDQNKNSHTISRVHYSCEFVLTHSQNFNSKERKRTNCKKRKKEWNKQVILFLPESSLDFHKKRYGNYQIIRRHVFL